MAMDVNCSERNFGNDTCGKRHPASWGGPADEDRGDKRLRPSEWNESVF